MAEFINTVDILGDDTFTDMIIDRSITECRSEMVKSIGVYAFNSCKNLITADFSALTSIGNAAFGGCTNLSTLILRNTSGVSSLGGTSAFNSTKIMSGTGYIYVPRALVDSYKSATNWSTYANQFRALEDYTVDGTTMGELDPTKI